MSGSIYIVHTSEFLQIALQKVLEDELSQRIFCANSVSEILHKYSLGDTSDVFILSEEMINSDELVLLQARCKDSLFIALSVAKSIEKSVNGFEMVYSIYEPVDSLRSIITSFYNEENLIETEDDLTVREKEVLRLIALGYTNKLIAETLFISAHTVISHRKNITDKLGIKSISGLTVYAIIQKIISYDDLAEGHLQ